MLGDPVTPPAAPAHRTGRILDHFLALELALHWCRITLLSCGTRCQHFGSVASQDRDENSRPHRFLPEELWLTRLLWERLASANPCVLLHSVNPHKNTHQRYQIGQVSEACRSRRAQSKNMPETLAAILERPRQSAVSIGNAASRVAIGSEMFY